MVVGPEHLPTSPDDREHWRSRDMVGNVFCRLLPIILKVRKMFLR